MLCIELARGIRIALPPDPKHISTYVFVEQEDWFEDEAEFVSRVAEAGGRMLDIGSSYGFYSLSYARAAGPAARIWAFEPTPVVCTFFRESIRINDFANITLTETAVGAAVGRSRFKIEPSSELNRVDAAGDVEVQIAPLDALDAEHGFGNVDFVKLDVEGHEASVIAGGAAFFARESPLVMLEVSVGNAVDLLAGERLKALGYDLYRLVPQLGVLIPLERTRPDACLLNVFACKPDRAAHLAERGLLCATPVEPAPIASGGAVLASLRRIPALAAIGSQLDGLFRNLPSNDPLMYLLGYELASRDHTAPVAARCASLRIATSIAREIVTGQADFPRAVSAARVLRAWGERGDATNIILQLLRAILDGVECPINTPFIPPLLSSHGWLGHSDPCAWLSASVIEAAALWSSYASCWGEPTSVPTADILQRFGRQSPLFERRRQLRRMLEGLQVEPEPHPLLRAKTPDNLNPTFWCGANP